MINRSKATSNTEFMHLFHKDMAIQAAYNM